MTIYEGSIISCNAEGAVFRYLIEEAGRIVWVGDQIPEKWADFPIRHLGGSCMVPAFADTHLHYMSYAVFNGGLDVRHASTIAQIIESTQQFARQHRDKIVIGFGASAHSVAEARMITRQDLDLACPSRPVFLVKYDGHAAVANSALIKLLPESLKLLRGFNAELGLMEQEAFFKVTDFVTATISIPNTLGRMVRAMDGLAAKGIGMIHSVSGVGFPGDMDVSLESLFAKGIGKSLRYRVFFQTMDIQKAVKRHLPRIGGCFACALDGCFGSLDAALDKPYEGSTNNGILYFDDATVQDFCRQANRAGLQIEMHAIGERAFDQAVHALVLALKDFPRQDHRHTIIHGCLANEQALDLCAQHGVAIAVQPAFIHWDQEPQSYLEKHLGERANHLNPLKAMLDRGITIAGGSDAPCTEPDPLYGIWAAVNHSNPKYAISVQEALNMFTRNAAWLSFDEAETGSLELGKSADMVILSDNILKVKPEAIRGLKVQELIMAGRPYRPGKSALGIIGRGLFSETKI